LSGGRAAPPECTRGATVAEGERLWEPGDDADVYSRVGRGLAFGIVRSC